MLRRNALLLTTLIILLLTANITHAKFIATVEPLDADFGDLTTPQVMLASTPVYGRLATFDDVDAYGFNFTETLKSWTVELYLPICGDHFTHFAPSFAIIGAGLEQPADGQLPFALPDGSGAIIVTSDDPTLNPSITPMGFVNGARYKITTTVTIPQVGAYTVAIWETNGHQGAYHLQMGTFPAAQAEATVSPEEMTAFELVDSGAWMGWDCDTSIALDSCPLTAGEPVGDARLDAAPERSIVGEGYSLTGTIRDSSTCLPVANAQILFWMANGEGVYDDGHRGTLYTNRQGAYRIRSERPGGYGPAPHIHLYITAAGYKPLMTTFALSADETVILETLDLTLAPTNL